MGITGCCNKSENENITSSPRVFESYIFFTRLSNRSPRTPWPSGVGDGHPKPTRALRPQQPERKLIQVRAAGAGASRDAASRPARRSPFVPVWLLHAILLPIKCWRLWQGISRRRALVPVRGNGQQAYPGEPVRCDQRKEHRGHRQTQEAEQAHDLE